MSQYEYLLRHDAHSKRVSEAELNDPRVITLCQQMIQLGKRQAQTEKDRYRDLLEARISGLEAMLTAFVQQAKDSPNIDANLVKKAAAYLAGTGNL